MQYNGFAAVLIAALALPAAEYSTYIGDQNAWTIRKLVIDSSGNTYVAGSRTFIQPNASEAIVAKVDINGKTVLFVGLGGKGNDVANAVAVDGAGNIYLAGSTTSPNFPVKNALDPNPPAGIGFLGGTKGFVAKLTAAGDIVYSTYFPSPVDAIAADSAGSVYLTGTTYSRDFPTTSGLPKGSASPGVPIISGAFLTKIDPFGAKIVYSAVISGGFKPCGAGSSCQTSSRGANGVAVAVDAAGNAYLSGNSNVTDLPTTPGVLASDGSGAFVAKVNAAGSAIVYLTYLGSGGITLTPYYAPATVVAALAVDRTGNAFLAGYTFDPKLPLDNRFHGWSEIQPFAPQSSPDVFAMKLNPSGTAVLWGHYLGGDASDLASSATLDSAGNFWVAGTTNSTEFPNRDGWSTGEDFIAEYDSTGALSYTARYPTGTIRQSIAADSLIHTATTTGVVSAVGPNPHPAVRPWTIGPNGGQVAPGMVVEIFGPHIGGPGAQVFFNDLPARLLYSGDQQINTVVPMELDGQKTARVRIGPGPEFVVAVLPAMPRILAAVNEDGVLNSWDNPARPGSIMTAWVTGVGPYPGRLLGDGVPLQMVYADLQQINFVVPDRSSNLVLTSRNVSSPSFFVLVR